MTIIHLSSRLGGGGAEQMVFQLAKQSHKDIRTIVISIASDNGLGDKFKEYEIEHYFLDINSFKNQTFIDGIKKLNSIVGTIHDAVFHCHLFHGYLLGFIYNIKYKTKPIVFTLHSSVIEEFYRKLLLYLTKSFRKADIIFSLGAKKWYNKNCIVIPNGIDFDALKSEIRRQHHTSKTFSFLYLGRLSHEKNPLYMIRAAEKLLESGIENFVFKVVGIGNLHDELVDKIETHHLTKHFNLHGFQHNIKEILDDSHCLILPSLWEGMPVVVLEAAAASLPVISTPVGSIPDILNNSNAYLNTLEHFHESMIKVVQNYEEALLKAEKLHNEMKAIYNIDNVFKMHLELYESSLKS